MKKNIKIYLDHPQKLGEVLVGRTRVMFTNFENFHPNHCENEFTEAAKKHGWKYGIQNLAEALQTYYDEQGYETSIKKEKRHYSFKLCKWVKGI